MQKTRFLVLLFFFWISAWFAQCQNIAQIDSMAAALSAKGKLALVDSLYLLKLDLLEKKSGKGDSLYWDCLNALAVNAFKLGNFKLAEKYIKVEQEIYQANSDTASLRYARICNNLATVYLNLSKNDLAESFFEQARSLRAKILGKKSVEYANTCNGFGQFYKKIGNFEKALALSIEAKDIQAEILGKENSSYAITCANLGATYSQIANYSQAEACYLEAKSIFEKISGRQGFSYANTINGLGSLYNRQGLHKKALVFFLESEEVIRSTAGTNHPAYQSVASNLGQIYISLREFDKAAEFLLKAKEVAEYIFGKDSESYASACTTLAVLYQNKLDYQNAEPLLLEAMQIFEKNGKKESVGYANTCNNLASQYIRLGLYEKAEPLLFISKRIRLSVFGNQHSYYAQACTALGHLYESKGEVLKADSLFREAIALKLKEIERVLPTLSEKERVDFLEKAKVFMGFYKDFACKFADKYPQLLGNVFDYELFTKGLVFSSTQKMRNQILSSKDSVLIEEYQQWKNIKEKYNQVLSSTLSERASMGLRLDSLEQLINDLERNISRRSSAFAQNVQTKQYNWQELRAALGKNEALVEIIRVDAFDAALRSYTQYAALIVSEQTKEHPVLVLLDSTSAFEGANVKYHQNAIQLKKEDLLSYNLYWKPIEAKLKDLNPKGFSRVYLSPEGVYHTISLASLMDPVSGKYLSELVSIHIVGSSRDVIEVPKGYDEKSFLDKNGFAVLFGFPDYELKQRKDQHGKWSSLQLAIGEEKLWPSLPGSKMEIDEIEVLLENQGILAESFMGEMATEEALKGIKSPLLLHIATHGYFVSAYHGRQETLEDAEKRDALSQPLQRSGLALAGCASAKTAKEDGILTAAEAMTLNLEQTSLVVLSACETGLGDLVEGDGVYGLQRAFQQAGAKTVVMSLWKVNDEATQQFMKEFYRLLAKGKSKLQAFNTAQNLMRKKYKHAYYWAAFVLVGRGA